MFELERLKDCMSAAWFKEGQAAAERSLLRARLGLQLLDRDESRFRELTRFSQAVLASVSRWEGVDAADMRSVCSAAGDIEASLAISRRRPQVEKSLHLLRAAVLYDLAGLPSNSASSARRDGFEFSIRGFFTREGPGGWGRLLSPSTDDVEVEIGPFGEDDLIKGALGEVLDQAAALISQRESRPGAKGMGINYLKELCGQFLLELDGPVLEGIAELLKRREQSSTIRVLRGVGGPSEETLRSIEAPSELWPVQVAALKDGLLDSTFKSFGLAAPTGTGKTALTTLLLTNFLQQNPGKKAFYVCPSRALSVQIARDLQRGLAPIGASVLGLGSKLSFDSGDLDPQEADVLVFTPEKADLLLRVQPEVVDDTELIVVDEAHHIEQGTRGILLEFYLWRLRALVKRSARIVQLSAVAPNISELVDWLAPQGQSQSVKLDWRAGRLRLGVFERGPDGSGIVRFEDEAPYQLLEKGECVADKSAGVAQLANRLAGSGIVLVLTTSPKRAETLASLVAEGRAEGTPPEVERLDARLERELYPTCPLRMLVRKRVAYHHAQLPPRVRTALEGAIADRKVEVVCATTTLAEGVNFPFSTVIVDSLVGQSYELSPRALWNIAGRAGRFGVDSEGHCILFRPSLWRAKLKEYSLEEYLTTKLDGIPPVRSALAVGLTELKDSVDSGAVDERDLESVELTQIVADGKASKKAKRLRGLLNVMRVGYAHAGVSRVLDLESDDSPEFAGQGLLASRQVAPDVRDFAVRLGVSQRRVITKSLSEDSELLEVAARIGWSLETQSVLLRWVETLEDWQIRSFGEVVRGGWVVQTERLGYLLGPLAKRMQEFEGDILGGSTSYVAAAWIAGEPLVSIGERQQKSNDYGSLVRTIYARVQYMLPWALFGLDALLQREAGRRHIAFSTGVRDLSSLASEGVPGFDAVTLVTKLELERVDATRLARAFRRRSNGQDILAWFAGLSWSSVAGIVRGAENRRLDPDLKSIHARLTRKMIG